jgi:hypothetical protein
MLRIIESAGAERVAAHVDVVVVVVVVVSVATSI